MQCIMFLVDWINATPHNDAKKVNWNEDISGRGDEYITVLFTHLQMKVRRLYNELINYPVCSFNYALMEVT